MWRWEEMDARKHTSHLKQHQSLKSMRSEPLLLQPHTNLICEKIRLSLSFEKVMSDCLRTEIETHHCFIMCVSTSQLECQ